MGVEVAQDGSALNRFTFVPTIVIKGVPTHHIDLENATRDNRQKGRREETTRQWRTVAYGRISRQ